MKAYICPDCGGPRSHNSTRCRRCNANAMRAGKVKRASVNPNAKRDRRTSGPGWTRTLSAEQVKAVSLIRHAHNGTGRKETGSEGWRVYVMPSTLPATYLELRHYMAEGRVARWVIERDGTVSADNDRGQLAELEACVQS